MERLHRRNPLIGITIGDPSGIGPEIVIKALKDIDYNNIILYGPKNIWLKYNKDLPYKIITFDYKNFTMGKAGKENGRIAYKALEMAINDALTDKIDTIVTAPLNKYALNYAGYNYSGQTEILREKTKKEPIMVMGCKDKIFVDIFTRHIPLKDVPKNIKKEKIFNDINILSKYFSKIGVLGLNPHAGEDGLVGKEEIKEIIPAIEECFQKGIDVKGPIPADTVVWDINKYDLLIAMYHDQGTIIVKSLCGIKTINISFNLPFLRVSPGHGTAYDIAGKNIADHTSMKEAILYAIDYTENTEENRE